MFKHVQSAVRSAVCSLLVVVLVACDDGPKANEPEEPPTTESSKPPGDDPEEDDLGLTEPLDPPPQPTPPADSSSDPCRQGDVPEVVLPCEPQETTFDASKWTSLGEDTTVTLWGDNRLYVLPGNGLVRVLPADQSRQAARLGISATGSSGSAVFTTSDGRTALMVDTGSSSEHPKLSEAVFMLQLRSLMSGMRVQRIHSIHITHAHGDHINQFEAVVREASVPASAVFIDPIVFATSKALQTQWDRLAADPVFSKLGYQRGGPTEPVYRERQGELYHTARFPTGTLVVEYSVPHEALERLRAKLAQGKKPGSAAMDAASALMTIRELGTIHRFVVTGDLRGHSLNELRQALNADGVDNFSRLFRDVQVVKGAQHHLGVVNKGDLAGIRHFLEATVAQNGSLRVLVQVDRREELGQKGMRRELVRALNEMGVDVFVTLNPLRDGHSGPSEVVANATGEVSCRGEHAEFHAAPEHARRMARKIGNVRRFLRTLEREREALRVSFGDEALQEIETQLRAEDARLGRLFRARIDLTVGLLEGKNKVEADDVRLDRAALERNAREFLRTPKELSKALTADTSTPGVRVERTITTLNRLARYHRHEAEITRLVNDVLEVGRMTPALEELLQHIDPELKARYLANPARRGRLRAALRNAAYRRQLLLATGVPRRLSAGKRVGAGMLALLEIGKIALETHLANEDMTNALLRRANGNLLWWAGKHTLPAFSGIIDDVFPYADVPVGDFGEVQRRLQNGTLDGLEVGVPTDELAVMSFLLWNTINVKTLDDYWLFYRDDPNAPLRRRGKGEWQAQIWTWDTTPVLLVGGMHSSWQDLSGSGQLTTLLEAMHNRMIEGTERMLADKWQTLTPLPSSDGPILVPAPDDELPPKAIVDRAALRFTDLRPTRRVEFEAGADRVLRSVIDPDRILLGDGAPVNNQWWGKPDLLAFDRAPAPQGYVVVAGADYDSYASIRTAETYQFEASEAVPIPIPAERTEHQRQLLEIPLPRDVDFLPDEDHSGYLVYWFSASNRAALGLARSEDLKDVAEPPEVAQRYGSPQESSTTTTTTPFEAPAPVRCEPPEPVGSAETSDAGTPASQPSGCRLVDCDCDNVDFGLSVITREYEKICRASEEAANARCRDEGLQGGCHPTASGPNPR